MNELAAICTTKDALKETDRKMYCFALCDALFTLIRHKMKHQHTLRVKPFTRLISNSKDCLDVMEHFPEWESTRIGKTPHKEELHTLYHAVKAALTGDENHILATLVHRQFIPRKVRAKRTPSRKKEVKNNKTKGGHKWKR